MARESALREQHEKAGAQQGVYFGCLLPARFVNAETEYRRAKASVALVDTSHHAFIYLDGPDRVRFLNALLTNNIKDLAAGQGNIALLLNPQGHILAEVETYALPGRLLTLSHALVRERTVAWLDKYIIMDDVTLDDVTDRHGSVVIEGPEAAAILRELCGIELEAMPQYSHMETTVGGVPGRVLRKSLYGLATAELITERGALATLWESLLKAAQARGGGPIGWETLNVLRLEAGIPWFSYDFDDKTIPHEAALEQTHVSFSKGCYTGQEIVERVRSRGQVNRRRVGLGFPGTNLPGPGAKLLADGKEAGHVTSAALSPALGGIGMGYVRRESNAPGSRLQWELGAAEVIELPVAAPRAPRSLAS